MEIRVKAYSYDFLSKEKMFIKDGTAYLFNDNCLSYLEGLDNSGVRHEIKWSDGEVILKRIGNGASITHLKLNEFKEAKVESMYGELIFDSYMTGFIKSDDLWEVEYKLFNQGDLITHVKVTWELKGIGADC